jgi:uncharacterized membrane protein
MEQLTTEQRSDINISDGERIVSAAGGALLLLSGITAKHPFSLGALVRTVAGGYLIFRGSSGHCHLNSMLGRDTSQNKNMAMIIKESMTINRPVEEIYSYWRQLENLPRFMTHLKEVKELDTKRSHWEAKIPGGIATVKWNAEITREEPNELLSWRSIAGSVVDNAGHVLFREAGDNRTEIQATISYHPPAGDLGAAVAKLFNNVFEKMVRDDLRRFRTMMETRVGVE